MEVTRQPSLPPYISGTYSSLTSFLTDHLTSVTAVLDASGALLQQQRYYPFGEVRDLPNDGLAKISATDFGYTGQRALDAQGNSFGLGLMDYKARFYDAYLSRWTQPDSIIPDGNPQSLNRYSYVNNSPIGYNDPSGHRFTDQMTDPVEKDIIKQTYPSLAGANALAGAKDELTKAGVEVYGRGGPTKMSSMLEMQCFRLVRR